VAARASQIEAEARIELLKENAEKVKQDGLADETSSNISSAANPNAYEF
jgi:hypothetical protein